MLPQTIIDFIQLPGQVVPNDVKTPGWNIKRDEYGNTPLMLWLKYRVDESIPSDFFYENYQTDKNLKGETPLMIWVQYQPIIKAVPRWLMYEDYQTDKNALNQTALKIWSSIFTDGVHPEMLKYDGWIKDLYPYDPFKEESEYMSEYVS